MGGGLKLFSLLEISTLVSSITSLDGSKIILTQQWLDLSCSKTSSTVSVGWILWLTVACFKRHDDEQGRWGDGSPRPNSASHSPWIRHWTWWRQWSFSGSHQSRSSRRELTKLPRREAKGLKESSEDEAGSRPNNSPCTEMMRVEQGRQRCHTQDHS